MFAYFKSGGKQFRAEPGVRLRIPSIEVEPGESVTFDEVLVASDEGTVKVGEPTVDGAKVKAEVLRHGRDKKVIVFKRKRRKGYRKKQGFTEILVSEVVV